MMLSQPFHDTLFAHGAACDGARAAARTDAAMFAARQRYSVAATLILIFHFRRID